MANPETSENSSQDPPTFILLFEGFDHGVPGLVYPTPIEVRFNHEAIEALLQARQAQQGRPFGDKLSELARSTVRKTLPFVVS